MKYTVRQQYSNSTAIKHFPSTNPPAGITISVIRRDPLGGRIPYHLRRRLRAKFAFHCVCSISVIRRDGMPKSEKQKQKLLYIEELLRTRTDEDHAVTTPQIIDYLEQNDIKAERKSI